MKVGIIGLGLMGGSLALELKKLSFIDNVIGSDHNDEHIVEALKLGLVDKIASFDEIKVCDIIILAVPVDAVISILQDLKDVKESTTIIDLGSTKEKILNSVPSVIRKNFVAAHPMTGTENFGPSAAFEGLYKDKVVVLCNLEDSGDIQQEVAVRIFSQIHMKLTYMKACEHDRHAAFISHMPHVLSFSIANTVLAQEDRESILAMAGGGFRSMSRIAKSSPTMWEDIFRQNKDNVLDSLEIFEKELSSLKKAIKQDDWDSVNTQLKEGRKLHDIFE